MESESFSPSIRESLDQLASLIDEPWTRPHDHRLDAIGSKLEQLEQALGDVVSEQRLAESLGETRWAHPRLIAMCTTFDRDGRTLLRHAALVLRLSARQYQADEALLPKFREAVASLIDAGDQYLHLQDELAGEVAQEIGGEG